MDIKPCFCPNCGGKIVPIEGRNTVFCTYCGSCLRFDEGTVKVEIKKTETIHHIDDAAILHEKTNAQIEKMHARTLRHEHVVNAFRSIVIALLVLAAIVILGLGLITVNYSGR